MEDKYGIKLELDTGSFKRKLQESQKLAQETGQTMKKSLSMSSDSLFNNNEITRRYIQHEAKVSNLNINYGALNRSMKLTKDNAYSVSDAVKEVGQSEDDVSNKAKKLSLSFDNAFGKKMVKSIKRLTLGMLGVRSAFSLFRSQLNNYMSINSQFAAKMQLTSNVITNAMAPAFEFFGNVIQYVVIGLAEVIEILTGIPILSNTIESGLKGASEAASDLNDNLTGLDEITNLGGNGGSGLASGISDDLGALEEFKKKIQEVKAWLEKSGIKKFLETIKPTLSGIWNWVTNHPWETILGIAAFKGLGLLLPTLIGGSGFGLIGLAGAISAIPAIVIAVDGINDLKEMSSELTHLSEKAKNVQQEMQQMIETDETTTEDNNKIFRNAYTSITGQLIDLVSAENVLKKETSGLAGIFNDLAGTTKDFEEGVKDTRLVLDLYINNMKTLYKTGKLNAEQTKEYKEALLVVKEAIGEAGLKGEYYENILKDINQELIELDGIEATANLNVDTSRAEKSLNSFLYKLTYTTKEVFGGVSTAWSNAIGKANGGIFTGSWQPIQAYAGGGLPSGGQMFMAREAGPELVGTIGGHTAVMNNDQIVASVAAGVAQAVAGVMGNNKGDVILNINGKEFAKATYSDYQNESARRGTNTSIRRV